MDYPANFDISAFPAGRRIALSRVMAIWTMIAFFVAVCLAGLIIWVGQSRQLDPFMISIDNTTGVWSVVGRGNWEIKASPMQIMQEAVVGKFAENWMTIAADTDENIAAWGRCSRDECVSGDGLLYGARRCALFCASGDDVFNRFVHNVMDGYTQLVIAGQTWTVDTASMQIVPVGKISDTGGAWRVLMTIHTATDDTFDVEAYARVARNDKNYPFNMGFYVADFNAYRMN